MFYLSPQYDGLTYGAGRDHKGHRALIWIAERAIQIKPQFSYHWNFISGIFASSSDFRKAERAGERPDELNRQNT